MKTAKDYLREANEVVPRIPGAEAIQLHEKDGNVFVDVRDSSAIAATGTIEGALRVPRGMMEFIADENMPGHNSAFTRDAKIYLVCGVGGQAALAGKTLVDMGFENVTNIGGISEWKEAGGPIES